MHMCHYWHTAGSKWNLKAQWDTWRRTGTVSATSYTKSHSVTHIPGTWSAKPPRGWCVCLWLRINFEDENKNEGTKPLQVSVSSGGLAVTLVSGFSVTEPMEDNSLLKTNSDTLHNSKALRGSTSAACFSLPWSQLINTGDKPQPQLAQS